MRTAQLHYIDTNGKLVGTEPISGNVGTTFDISHASVANYVTAGDNPTSYTFTAANRQSLVIHVAKQTRAELSYQTQNNKIVATEPISGAAGQQIDIRHASTPGYRTLGSAPTKYRLTTASQQQVVIPVQAIKQGITVEYVAGKHQVHRTFEEVATGATIPVHAPAGYRLVKPQARHMPAKGLATLTVAVTQLHGWSRLTTSVPFWALIGILLVVIWDQLTAYRSYRKR